MADTGKILVEFIQSVVVTAHPQMVVFIGKHSHDTSVAYGVAGIVSAAILKIEPSSRYHCHSALKHGKP